MKSVRAVLGAMLVWSLASVAWAQAVAGSQLAGVIKDSSGGVLPGASVTLVKTDTAMTRTATTSEDGLFTIVLLPPGTYSVTAQATNFAEAKVENVVVNVGRVVDVKIPLGVSAVTETVLVTAETTLQTTRNESDAVVNERAIQELPINGRRFQDFVTRLGFIEFWKRYGPPDGCELQEGGRLVVHT